MQQKIFHCMCIIIPNSFLGYFANIIQRVVKKVELKLLQVIKGFQVQFGINKLE